MRLSAQTCTSDIDFRIKMQILVTSCARNALNSHKRCTTEAKQAVHTSFTKHLGSPRCSVMHLRDRKVPKTCHGGGLLRQSYLLVMIYMCTLHVILSHTLGATSSITEHSSVILSHALQRLRRLLSVSEESVTDTSLRSA